MSIKEYVNHVKWNSCHTTCRMFTPGEVVRKGGWRGMVSHMGLYFTSYICCYH